MFYLRASICAGVLLAGAGAFAQSLKSFDLERLQLDPSAEGSLIIGTGEILPHGDYRLSLGWEYEHGELLLHQNPNAPELRLDRKTLGIVGYAWSPKSWLEVSATLNMVGYQRGTAVEAAEPSFQLARAGMGFPWIHTRFAILQERNGDSMSLALNLGVGLPLGTAGTFGLEDSPEFAPRVEIGKTVNPYLRVGAALGANIRRTTPLSYNVEDRVSSDLNGAVTAVVGSETTRGELVLRATNVPLTGDIAGDALAGFRTAITDGTEVFALAGPGFGSVIGTPFFRVLLGVAFGPSNPRASVCGPGAHHTPTQCPALDDDGDGVANEIDQCPLEAGPAANHGCPLKDSDGDGVPDSVDRCPTLPGPASNQGCPVEHTGPMADRDHDGVADSVDACPDEAGPASNQGCPEKSATPPPTTEAAGTVGDADGDGVPDAVDNCPMERGPADNQGCPIKKKQWVSIGQEKLELKDKVYFPNTGATILAKSYSLLNQVAELLTKHSEIKKVTIEGHTDSIGAADKNRKLSFNRATAIRNYLMKKGVAGSRLEAKGFGPDRPIDTNATAKGRANNRRIELTLGKTDTTP